MKRIILVLKSSLEVKLPLVITFRIKIPNQISISYTNIIFGVIIGVALGDAIPNIWTFIGIALVISSGLLVAFSKEK